MDGFHYVYMTDGDAETGPKYKIHKQFIDGYKQCSHSAGRGGAVGPV